MSTVTCTTCPKSFTKPSQLKADQALRMHVARVHDKTVNPNKSRKHQHHEHSGIVRLNTNGMPKKHKGKLTPEEAHAVVSFIQNRREQFPSKQACFTAALENAGVEKKIRNNSVAVQRYFEKADSAPRNGKVKTKRKYTKRQKVADMPVAQKTINFCQTCGQSIKAQALGSVIAERILAGATVTIDGEKVQYA